MDEAPKLDTSPAAQEKRRAAMKARLQEKGVDSVSQLSDLYGRAITYDGVAGTICYVDDPHVRFACDLEDGRRTWGLVDQLAGVDADMLVFTTPKPEGGA